MKEHIFGTFIDNFDIDIFIMVDNEILIFKEYQIYDGPLTMQLSKLGSIHSINNGLLIFNNGINYLAVSKLLFKNKLYSSVEFINEFSNIINRLK